MRERSVARLSAVLAVCAGMCMGSTALAVDFPETEPNDTKAASNVVTGMAPGDTLSGVTTGTSTTTAGGASSDNFDITTTSAGAPGIYRYRLVLTSATAGHTGTIRGLTVTAGNPNPGTDSAIQTSQTSSSPPRYVQWYANENPSRIIYRVTGISSTTATYFATLERELVTPSVVLSTVDAGPMFVSTIGQTTADTDLWLYDANFNAIPLAGNDDESAAGGGTGATTQSRLQRNLPAGTYYLALANFNLANSEALPTDEDGPVDPAMDYPNALCTSSTGTNADNDFVIGNRCLGTSQSVSNVRVGLFDVTFWQFTLAGPTLPDPVSMTAGAAAPASPPAGGSTVLSVTVTGGPPTMVTADLTAFGLTAAEAFADPDLNGVWEYTLNVPMSQATGPYNITVTATGSSCSPATRTIALTIPIAGDACTSAFAINVGDTVLGSNVGATNESPTPPTCTSLSTFNLGVWYTFTPSSSNRLTATTCNSGTSYNTRVYVYSGSCGALTCVGAAATTTPTCVARSDAASVEFCAIAGTQYFVLVTNDTSGTGTLELSVIDSGIDCSPPVNDNCAGALPIAVGGSVVGTSTNATNEVPAPVACNGFSTFNVGMWYTFTEGATARRLSANTCDVNTNHNTRVYVYTGACGALTCVTANIVASPACGVRSDAAEAVFCTTPNATYFILVTNDTTGTGTFGLNLTDTGIGCAPPPNDACANAIAVTGTSFMSTVAADNASDDIDTSCNATANSSTRFGVWYQFTPDEPGNVSFVESGAGDVIFSVFTGDCSGLTEVFCNTNEAGTVSFALNAGTTYYILCGLASATAAPPATYSITINYAITPGACCNGASCTITAGSAACASGGGSFIGYNATCGGGPLAANSNPTDVAIPEYVAANGPAPVSSVVNAVDTTVITDLDVYVTLSHSFSGDLYLRLQGPNGVTIDLARRVGLALPCSAGSTGDADDYAGTYIFDDDAAQTIAAEIVSGPNPIPPGNYIPATCAGVVTSLDAASPAGFGGIPVAGTWTLIVSDEDEISTGTIQDFGLVINGVQASSPCNQTGACCQGTTCVAATSGACTGANTSYSGDGTVCNVFGVNNTTPCCFADFNHVGGVTVQDIFDFLGAYFGANAAADINGGGIGVQDIFDYLASYFTGCV